MILGVLCGVWGGLFIFLSDPPINDGAYHVAIVPGSTGGAWRGADGCGIHVGDGNTLLPTRSASQRKHVSDLLAMVGDNTETMRV